MRLSLGQPEDFDQGSDFLELRITGDHRPMELLSQCCRKSISVGNSRVGLEGRCRQHPRTINGFLVYRQLINERLRRHCRISSTLALDDVVHLSQIHQ